MKIFDLKMYFLLIKMTLRSMMQYRADFWASLLGVFVLNGANLIQMGVISWKFTSLGEWQMGDLMLLYGLYMISLSMYSVFFNHITSLETEIADGTFDKYLFRPMSPFVQFFGNEIRYVGISDTILGICLLVVGKTMSGIRWGWLDALWLVIFIVCGCTIITCVRLILSCVSFWVVKSNVLQSMLMQVLLLTQKYPTSIFGDVLKAFGTGIIPVAFMNYYPAVMLLRKADEPAWMCMMSPLIAGGLVVISAYVWRKGIKRYGSAGG